MRHRHGGGRAARRLRRRRQRWWRRWRRWRRRRDDQDPDRLGAQRVPRAALRGRGRGLLRGGGRRRRDRRDRGGHGQRRRARVGQRADRRRRLRRSDRARRGGRGGPDHESQHPQPGDPDARHEPGQGQGARREPRLAAGGALCRAEGPATRDHLSGRADRQVHALLPARGGPEPGGGRRDPPAARRLGAARRAGVRPDRRVPPLPADALRRGEGRLRHGADRRAGRRHRGVLGLPLHRLCDQQGVGG